MRNVDETMVATLTEIEDAYDHDGVLAALMLGTALSSERLEIADRKRDDVRSLYYEGLTLNLCRKMRRVMRAMERGDDPGFLFEQWRRNRLNEGESRGL